jgi:hypothetical protein
MLAVGDGLLVDIVNVSKRVAQFNSSLKPFLEFGMVPIEDFSRRVANFGSAAAGRGQEEI